MSTHNLCFRAKIRKNIYPCIPQFYYIKVGGKGVKITRTCYHDVAGSSKFALRKWMDCTIFVAKTKSLIRCAVTAQQICAFVFAYAKSRFSHNAAHFIVEKKGKIMQAHQKTYKQFHKFWCRHTYCVTRSKYSVVFYFLHNVERNTCSVYTCTT